MNKKRIQWVRFTLKDQLLFARRLSFLLNAHIPLNESLRIIKDQTTNRARRAVFDGLLTSVTEGQHLSRALKSYEWLFGTLSVHLIEIGEHSGTLARNLLHLANELEKKQALRRKIMGALLYPLFITIASVGMTGGLVAYIFPKLLPIFGSLGAALPRSTELLIGASTYIRLWGIHTILAIAVCSALLLYIRKRNSTVRFYIDSCTLRIPFFGSLLRAYILTSITRTISVLLESNLPLSETLHMVKRGTSSLPYERALTAIAQGSEDGAPLWRLFGKHPRLFPELLVQLLMIGETAGTVAQTFAYVSTMYENDVEETTKTLSNAIEPALMLVMGTVVGFVAVSVITPIYQITQHLTPH